MLQVTGINRGSFSLLADAVERDKDYDWLVISRCAYGIARRMWNLKRVHKDRYDFPYEGEGALQALGLTPDQAKRMFFDKTMNKKQMVAMLRRVAAGGNV